MNKQILKIAILLLWCLSTNNSYAQNQLPENLQQKIEAPRYLRFMFYNCENFFDIYDDSLISDEEFLPDGDKHWNKHKYYDKLNKISKVIMAVGGWKPPELVGLCEIENRAVLNDLISKTQLYQAEYKIIHKESPDSRGIDVALLYQPKAFKPISTQFIKVSYTDNSRTTRDILYTKGLSSHSDTLHLFINHWPSRWGGQLESEDKREFVASLVRAQVDSILLNSPFSNIIIMGDLNDEPDNSSVHEILKAQTNTDVIENKQLYNLINEYAKHYDKGSHKYQGKWAILDHIIVSGSLLNTSNAIYTTPQNTAVFDAPFLLNPDNTYLGVQPNRTYIGFKYNAGFSDHLPVFFDINRLN